MGGNYNLDLARKYFEHTIMLCGNDLRSEYGMHLVCAFCERCLNFSFSVVDLRSILSMKRRDKM